MESRALRSKASSINIIRLLQSGVLYNNKETKLITDQVIKKINGIQFPYTALQR
jgi:hypothetical protein